ncbi:MAG: HgcAB-associated protein [candidate division WOR-3 bacterium]|nr:HgcAB-associated protein [candidate division WOR-3 bacterium]
MAKRPKSKVSCKVEIGGSGCCNIESLITLDERGQMVLPKEVREKANIRPGDKMAVVTWIKEGKTCCISLIKADEFSGPLKGILEPMAKEITKKGGTK